MLERQSVKSYRRAEDGSLEPAGSADLPADFRPQAIRSLPHGGFYVMGNGAAARIYGADGDGRPVLLQTLTGAAVSHNITVIHDDLLVSGGSALKWQGGGWVVQPLATVTSAILSAGAIVARPDRRYFYAPASSGQIPYILHFYVTLELVGGQLIDVGRAPRPLDSDLELTAAAIHPTTGDLYIANYNGNGGDNAAIHRYRSGDGATRCCCGHRATPPT